MSQFADKVFSCLSGNVPMAVFREPGSALVTGFFSDQTKPFNCNDLTTEKFVFAPFISGKIYCVPDEDKLVFKPEAPSMHPEAIPLPIDLKDKKAFEKIVAKAVMKIGEGHFLKVVVSRKQLFEGISTDAFAIFLRLEQLYPDAFVSLWHHPETGTWIGATPERLLSADKLNVQTMALAGTQLFKVDENPVWPQKEQQEQRVVTDFIWDKLEKFCGQLELSAPYTFKAGNLLHIRTDIHGSLEPSTDVRKIVKALHPTPAVCGMPRENALEFILNEESHDREFYAGYLGTHSSEKTNLFVNLRCMKLTGTTAEVFTGCGITAGSDPEKEYFETVNKAMTVGRVLLENK